MKKMMQIKTKAFTLVEMLFTLVIISILLLLFVPNLSKQKDVRSRIQVGRLWSRWWRAKAELFELNHTGGVSLSKLVEAGSITAEQSQTYKEYYAKHTDKTPAVAP